MKSSDRRGLPFSAVLGAVVGLALFAAATPEIRDIDLPWHLLAGNQLVTGTPPSQVGTNWSFATSDENWTSTQGLAEITLYGIHLVGGWTALAAFRVITAALAITILAANTLRARPAALAGFPFLVAGIGLVIASQERPQQATLTGAAILGGVLLRGMQGRLPAWFLVLPGTALWANLHGGWVLVPGVLGLIVLGRAADHGIGDSIARRAVGLAALATAAGLLTPAGVNGLTAVVRFSHSASLVREWQGVQPTHGIGILTLLMVVLVSVGWARSDLVPVSEVLAVVGCLVFTWLAWRNVAPGLALVAPFVAERLTRAFPSVSRSEPRWSVPLGVGVAVLLTLLGLTTMVGKSFLPTSTQPLSLAQRISELPAGQRVLNDYNVSGDVLYFGGEATQVAIDGRSDRYGAAFIQDYLDLLALSGDWKNLLEELDPTAALIREESPLGFYLDEVRGWTRLGSENGFTLLVKANQNT